MISVDRASLREKDNINSNSVIEGENNNNSSNVQQTSNAEQQKSQIQQIEDALATLTKGGTIKVIIGSKALRESLANPEISANLFSMIESYITDNNDYPDDLFQLASKYKSEKLVKDIIKKLLKQKIHAYHGALINEELKKQQQADINIPSSIGVEGDKVKQTSSNNEKKTSNWLQTLASYIIPAKEGEWGKVILLSCIGFLLIFSYSLLRIPKDLLIISVGGAELIPFLKIIGILPATMVSSFIWEKIKSWCATDVDKNGQNVDGNNKSFYIAIGIFSAFFISFILMFPYLSTLQGFSLAVSFIPTGVTSIFKYWAYSAFYVFTEMWSVIAIEGIFKGLQTALFKKDRVKALSASFGIWQNIGLMTAGIALTGVFGIAGLTLYSQMMIIVGLFVISGLVTAALHAYATKTNTFKFADLKKPQATVNTQENENNNTAELSAAVTAKEQITSEQVLIDIQKIATVAINTGSFSNNGFISEKDLNNILNEKSTNEQASALSEYEKDNIRKAFNTGGSFATKLKGIGYFRDIRDLAIVVLAYNVCMVIFEVVWKNQVKIFCSSGASTISYVEFMGQFNFWTAVISIGLAIINPLINKLPAEAQALMTPALLLCLSVVFFGLVLAPTTMATICPLLFSSSISNLYWQIALLGAIQNVIVKASKYTVFEPINNTSWSAKPKFVKDSYQGIVNQISGKWGKGLGSLILLGLLAFGGTISNIMIYIPAVILTILIVWAFSAYNIAGTVSGRSDLPKVIYPETADGSDKLNKNMDMASRPEKECDPHKDALLDKKIEDKGIIDLVESKQEKKGYKN